MAMIAKKYMHPENFIPGVLYEVEYKEVDGEIGSFRSTFHKMVSVPDDEKGKRSLWLVFHDDIVLNGKQEFVEYYHDWQSMTAFAPLE